MSQKLFELNPSIDRRALARRFHRDGRVQVRNLLTDETAATIARILKSETPWGFAYKREGSEPVRLRRDEAAQMPEPQRRMIANAVHETAAVGGYAVRFNQYPLLTAYQEKWAPGSPHDLLIEHINAEPMMLLVRELTGIESLKKADAQATLFGPGDFLSIHNDSHMAEGWRVAYVLNFSPTEWSPDWGGYLNFFDDDGDVVAGWRPRFNALNLFAVPQRHHVSYVPPFAPLARSAITGWFRDR